MLSPTQPSLLLASLMVALVMGGRALNGTGTAAPISNSGRLSHFFLFFFIFRIYGVLARLHE